MSSVAVLIPYRPGDCPWRRAAFAYVTARYRSLHPDWPVAVGQGTSIEWCKALAVADARKLLAADVLVVADADVLVDPVNLNRAVVAVLAGAPWAVPYEYVRRLNADATREVLKVRVEAAVMPPSEDKLARIPYRGVQGGGIVVVRAAVYDEVPLDDGFVGWGGEDESWGRALSTIVGPAFSIPGDCWHLWHPHALPGARAPVHPPSVDLLRAYQRADESPRLMRALLRREVAAEPVAVSPPVEYRADPGCRVVRAARRNVYFRDGRASVDDPDAVEVLDRTAGVTRA